MSKGTRPSFAECDCQEKVVVLQLQLQSAPAAGLQCTPLATHSASRPRCCSLQRQGALCPVISCADNPTSVQWHGWIKDYDSVTLMECRIDPILPHTRLPDMFAQQRAALERAMQRHSACHRVRAGISSTARPLELSTIPGGACSAPSW